MTRSPTRSPGWRPTRVHPDRSRRDSAGRDPRASRGGVRPPGVPRRRPRPAHPRRGREQGPRRRRPPRRLGPVAGPGRPRALRRGGRRLGAVQHPGRGRLSRRLGVTFSARADTVRDAARRPRGGRRPDRPGQVLLPAPRRDEGRWHELLRDHRATHGETPDRATRLRLAQQATLETRQLKEAPTPLVDQLTRWRAEADRSSATRPGRSRPTVSRSTDAVVRGPALADGLRRRSTWSSGRSSATWTRWNLLAEVERQIRPSRFQTSAVDAPDPPVPVATPCRPRRPGRRRRRSGDRAGAVDPDRAAAAGGDAARAVSSGGSPLAEHAAERYTTPDPRRRDRPARRRPRTHRPGRAGRTGPSEPSPTSSTAPTSGWTTGSAAFAQAFCTDDRRIVAAVGPAGSGKTTALRAASAGWDTAGRRVIPLATSAAAAEVLANDLGRRAENLHKFNTYTSTRHPTAPSAGR